jgi:hypothetical protein
MSEEKAVESTALVPQAPLAMPDMPGRELVSAPSAPVATWCSFKPTTARERMFLHTALDGGGLSFDEAFNQKLNIINIALQAKDVTEAETGELRRMIVTTLFLDDGRVVAGGSSGIHQSVLNILQSGWLPPFKPPLVCELYKLPVTRGHLYKMRVLSEGVTVDEHHEADSPLGKKRSK